MSIPSSGASSGSLAKLTFAGCLLTLSSHALLAQTTLFSYQGKLTDGGNPANGTFDLQFKLFDALTLGAQQGATVTLEDVVVSNGVFTVSLDFGAGAFSGAARFLEISVRPGASTGAFTLLAPRQPVHATPYAQRSLTAGSADNLSAACVACVTGGQIGSLPGNSGNYIQNSNSQQAASNFNISGNGTAGGTLSGNSVNAVTQFDLNGNRILANAGTNNLFAGVGAGAVNTGNDNAFFGMNAGAANTTGNLNAFFGYHAGDENSTGFRNASFGAGAGRLNTTGSNNTFVGYDTEPSDVGLTFATALGSGAIVTASSQIQLGRNSLDTVSIGMLTAASATHVCINGTVLSSCSSSQRYKQNVQPLRAGLNLIQRLRPVTFDWKERLEPDLGLIAEEVAKVEPRLVTHNQSGVIEGVKYDQLAVVLINAVKEQQAQITALQHQIKVLQQRSRRTPRKARAAHRLAP